MTAYFAFIRINLKLALREKSVLIFGYLFPLLFFLGFAEFMGDGAASGMTRIVSIVLVFGLLGNGLFGAGIRAVAEREAGILRRFKVAPISPAPILVASLVSGWLLYMPSVLTIVGIACFRYGMPFPNRWLSLLALASIGCVAMRSIGLVVAAVANSVNESNILVQLLYMPMLFISGATFPISAMPSAMQITAQFLPSAYLNTGIQRVIIRQDNIFAIPGQVAALALSSVLATFIAMKIFRWEKDQSLPRSAKLWLLAVFLPFAALGIYQARSHENIVAAKLLDREMRRSRLRLIRGAHVFTGDGRFIETGAVLIRNGRIDQVFEGPSPDPAALQAEAVEGAGRTLLPSLIDSAVDLSRNGALPSGAGDLRTEVQRALAAYLYCGVSTVGLAGDAPEAILALSLKVLSGERLGALPVRLSAAPAHAWPSLSAIEARDLLNQRDAAGLSRPLLQQAAPPELLDATRKALVAGQLGPLRSSDLTLTEASSRLAAAWKSGIHLAPATRSGAPLLLHGPAVHRELQLWVRAGIPPAAALQAATANAARLLGVGDRTGSIKPGLDADLLLVEGNPLEDIAATERISAVFFKGERVDRSSLFEQE